MIIKDGIACQIQEEDVIDGVCVIPNGVIELGGNLFYGNTKIKTVILPDGLQKIGRSAFESSSIIEIGIPNTVKSIQSSAFSHCEKLKELTIPDSVEEVEDCICSNCTNLHCVRLSNNLTYIPNNAFYNCEKLQSVHIPNKVQSIGSEAFMNCVNLEFVKMHSNVKNILCKAFYECVNLKNLILSEKLQIIESEAFARCYGLTSLNLPDSVKQIHYRAFSGVNIGFSKMPKNIEMIDKYSFSGTKTYHLELDKKDILMDIMKFPCYYDMGDKMVFSIEPLEDIYSEREYKKFGLECLIGKAPTLDYTKHRQLIIPRILDCWKVMPDLPYDQTFLEDFPVVKPILSEDVFYRLMQDKKNGKGITSTFFFKMMDMYYEKPARLAIGNLAYNLGAFYLPLTETKKTKNGNMLTESVNYGHMAYEFFRLYLEPILKESFHDYIPAHHFGSMGLQGLKPDFIKFISKKENAQQLMEIEKIQNGFFARCYNEFEVVQAHCTRDKGEQDKLRVGVDNFLRSFGLRTYEGVTPKTQRLANVLAPFYEKQEVFDYVCEVDRKREEFGVPNHILKNPVVDMTTLAIKKKRGKEHHQILVNFQESNTPTIFGYDFIAKDDVVNFILGKLCQCCAHPAGVGKDILEASILDENMQNIGIMNQDGIYIAKSTFVIHREEGDMLLNDFEVHKKYLFDKMSQDITKEQIKARYREAIFQKFMQAIRDFVAQYNLENPKKPILQVNIGMEGTKLEEEIKHHCKKSIRLMTPPNFTKYAHGPEDRYEGNAKKIQYVLWEHEMVKHQEEQMEEDINL